MNDYMLTNTADLRREELLREAEQFRVATQVRDPHPWRHRLGDALIRMGKALADEPVKQRARVA